MTEPRMAREVFYLREAMGDEVALVGDGSEERYRVLTEFDLDGTVYAVLKGRRDADGEDWYLFRVRFGNDGPVAVEPIEDEDEWERAAEAFDEWLYFQEEENAGR
ncbi:DUF1292 domain-containing protein [Calditerricola satsumensis]|uniref:DUF1292 domain-containing protein n=1 Tax=Calditerricola satsumensis TaxID=373054 RepID=A0A8J3BDD7_9BACI|nr:DUF1292 domain-containing protein [Calditerricola satsumensis]GGK05751.1 hypothetical protein GCM10007043_19740 [Calditerricola satsumensis]